MTGATGVKGVTDATGGADVDDGADRVGPPSPAPSPQDRPVPSVLTNVDPALRAAWHPVLRVADLGDEPVAVTLLGEDWVVVRLDGEVVAFADRCPHRLAPLSLGSVERGGETQDGDLEGDVLRCGYHGWCFAAAGGCTAVPALGPDGRVPPRARATSAAGVAEHLGLVWIAPDDPLAPQPPDPVPPDEAGTFALGDLPVLHAAAGAGLLMDNFLDVAHFPFVHGATIGATEAAEVGEVTIARDGLTMTVRSRHQFPNREDPAVATGERPLLQTRRVTYRYTAPFAASLRIDYEEAGGSNVITFFVQPVDKARCRIYSTVARNDLDGDAHRLADAVAFEHAVVAEDLRIQEAYRDRSLPLDLTVEVHTRADRTTVELRRILTALVAQAALTAPPAAEPAAEGAADPGNGPAERSTDGGPSVVGDADRSGRT